MSTVIFGGGIEDLGKFGSASGGFAQSRLFLKNIGVKSSFLTDILQRAIQVKPILTRRGKPIFNEGSITARALRITYPGAFYHVISRGNECKAVFKSSRDRQKFLEYLQSAFQRNDTLIHAYCLMDNQNHLLLETPSGHLLQKLMEYIYSFYSKIIYQAPKIPSSPIRAFKI